MVGEYLWEWEYSLDGETNVSDGLSVYRRAGRAKEGMEGELGEGESKKILPISDLFKRQQEIVLDTTARTWRNAPTCGALCN